MKRNTYGKSRAGTRISIIAVAVAAGSLALLYMLGIGPFNRGDKAFIGQTETAMAAENNTATEGKVLYQCPMHPQYTSDRPGQCPICGMDLVKVQTAPEETAPAAHEHAGQESMKMEEQKTEPQGELYQCPMHPQYTSNKPGKCPICGMDLVKVKQEPQKQEGHETGSNMENMPPGLGMVSLTDAKRQLIGVQTVPAKREIMTKTTRVSAIVAVDERRVKQVQSKVQGWVEKLYVNFTGQKVKRGQALMAVYSPDLVSTQEEYLLALRNYETLKDSPDYIRGGAEDLLNAARRRLRYWDVSNGQIRALERSGKPFKNLTIFSPASGFVLHTNMVEGTEVKPGMPLYTIADLSKVWVMAQVHELDVENIRVGMEASFLPDAYPGREFTGKVTYLDPQLDPKTKTLGVRIEFDNKDMELRPEMSGDAVIEARVGEALVVPASAVMDNGDVKVVFVEVEPGQFMPRKVKVGVRTSDNAQILEGLEEGEKVVVQGNFLLDSESRLRASVQGAMAGHHH